MKVLSSHCSRGLSDKEVASGDFSESLKWWDQSIAAHKAAGMKYIVNPGIGVPKTMKEMKMYCDYFNEIGKRCQQNGMKFGYHNHAHEFQKVENQAVMLDYMIENTNPEYVFFSDGCILDSQRAAQSCGLFQQVSGTFHRASYQR